MPHRPGFTLRVPAFGSGGSAAGSLSQQHSAYARSSGLKIWHETRRRDSGLSGGGSEGLQRMAAAYAACLNGEGALTSVFFVYVKAACRGAGSVK